MKSLQQHLVKKNIAQISNKSIAKNYTKPMQKLPIKVSHNF